MSNYIKEEGRINGKDEVELSYQAWVSPREKALLILVHGLGEHCGRYSNLVDQLSGKGISIYGMDLRGHGNSDGKRGHADSFLDYVHDLKSFIELIKEKHGSIPIFMLGNSLGATIACRYVLQYQEDLSGVVFTAGAFKAHVKPSGFLQKSATLLSKIVPGLQQSNGIDPVKLSHDQEVVDLYQQDELVHNKVTLKFYDEYLKNVDNCLGRAIEIRLPVLVLHGGADEITDVKGSELLFEKISSEDKEIRVFENLYHEIMNENGKERSKVLTIISKWLNERIAAASKLIKSEKKATPAKKEDSVKPASVKKVAKKSTKKAVKKAATKAVKKAVKKVAKKSVKKVVKKAVKKAVKKSVKKVVKKAVKKAVKKSVKKTAKKS